MNQHTQFDLDLASCNTCAGILQKFKVDPSSSEEAVVPRPIVSGIRRKPLMVIGQTPGLSEYRTGKPFQGSAGQGIRRILADLGVQDFDSSVFSSAVAKCFAGRKHRKTGDPTSKCEDRPLTTAMIRNCRPHLQRQIALANPTVIITLGGFALEAFLQMTGKCTSNAVLAAYVGTTQDWDGHTVVFFPHTSGSARWLNDPANRARFRQAQVLLRCTLLTRGLIAA